MAVRIDEAGDDDIAFGFDHEGISRAQIVADRKDRVVLDQHVRPGLIAETVIHREDETAANQDPFCHSILLWPRPCHSSGRCPPTDYVRG